MEAWSIYDKPSENVMGEAISLLIVGADGFPVAEVNRTAILPDYDTRTGHTHWAHGEGEAFIERTDRDVLAIATLAAAAPRLLEALSDLANFIGMDNADAKCDDCQRDEDELCAHHALLAEARAAIAAARGENQ